MSLERPTPYIGISGINDSSLTASAEEALTRNFSAMQFSREDSSQCSRQLALGVKAVHKTQYLDIENSYGPHWYPIGENSFYSALSDENGSCLKVAQIAFSSELVLDRAYLDSFMERILRRGKKWINTLQFDMLPWHKDSTFLTFLEELKTRTNHKIILQAHGESMTELGPQDTIWELGRFASSIDYVLFDSSCGKGIPLNSTALLPFLDAGFASEKLKSIGFGIAGGLNADTVRSELPALLQVHPNISWDAEKKLHDTPTLALDMVQSVAYLHASVDVIKSSAAINV